MHPAWKPALLSAALAFAILNSSAAAAATSVALGARMGDKAVLIINGKTRTLSIGASDLGVRLLSLAGDRAMIEVDGQRVSLLMGSTPVDLSGEPAPGHGSRVVLAVGSGGHFSGAGSINGRPVNFLVDTGASQVALSQTEAERIGLKYRDSPRGMVQTANGTVPVHSVRLGSVRIGDVQVYDVAAIVIPAQMDQVLLGNSFLGRFQMRSDNDKLTLDKKP